MIKIAKMSTIPDGGRSYFGCEYSNKIKKIVLAGGYKGQLALG